jgi:hypothetical protein
MTEEGKQSKVVLELGPSWMTHTRPVFQGTSRLEQLGNLTKENPYVLNGISCMVLENSLHSVEQFKTTIHPTTKLGHLAGPFVSEFTSSSIF